ncbi:MAG: STAS domain-containing protein, partial [Ilumatobacteraceae bacterium]
MESRRSPDVTETSSARVLPTPRFPIGTPYTFVIDGCPVALTRRDHCFEIRPQGDIHDGNADAVGHIMEVVLHSRRPVTLLLADLCVVDEAGVRVLDHALAAAKTVGVEWTVLGLPTLLPTPDSARAAVLHAPNAMPDPAAVPSMLPRLHRLVGLALR